MDKAGLDPLRTDRVAAHVAVEMIHGTAAAPVGQTLDTHRVVDVEHHHPDTGGPHRPQGANC